MESKNAIEIKNLSKMYRLYNKPSDRLKDSLGFGEKETLPGALRIKRCKL